MNATPKPSILFVYFTYTQQTLKLGDDLAMEVRVLEAQDDELNRSDRHHCLL